MIAVTVSWIAFRLQGGYFAIGTWVIAEVFRLSFANLSVVGGGSDTSLTALRGIDKATRESVTYWTAFAIFMVVIGGIGRIEGPIAGAIIFWALNKFFSDYGTWYLLGLGLMAIVVTISIFFKQGLWGWAQQRYGWTLFPTQRRLEAGETNGRLRK